MAHGLSDHLLSRLSEFVAKQTGLHFPRERWGDLERGIRSAAPDFDAPDADSCAQRLLSAPLARNQIEILAGALTVGETYFFRDQRCFAALGDRVLPDLIQRRQGGERRLRAWSAGCATGEEAYSLAIMLDRALPDARQWHLTILGTDINARFLQKASEGVFGEWSFRDAPVWLKQKYFREVGRRRFEILPRIKEMVTFTFLNLADDVYPSLANNTNAMDVIFCRNVLMYFAPERARKVVHNFHQSLVNSGWLIVSPAETSAQLFSSFLQVCADGAVLYRKTDRPGLAPAESFSGKTKAAPPLDQESGLPGAAFVFGSVALQESNVSVSPAAEPTGGPEPTSSEEALALFERGHYAELVQRLKTSSARLQAAPETLALLARACANLGELAEARQWVEKAIAADKLNAALHYLRANILQEQGASEEAVASLKRALYLEPDFVLAHFALGNHALRQGKVHEADKHFANALALLAVYQPEAVLPCSDGLAAGRLRHFIESAMSVEKAT